MENCVMLAEYHDEDDMTPVQAERMATIENEIKHLRRDAEEARKESRHERNNVRMALEAQIIKVDKNQAEIKSELMREQADIKADLTEIKDFIQQAKGVKWFIGFVTTVAATLSSIGVYKLFFPK